MDNFIAKIVSSITAQGYNISVVSNPDGFLCRPDTQEQILNSTGLLLLPIRSSLELRIRYELEDKISNKQVCYITDIANIILPDIKKNLYIAPTFSIAHLLPACNEMALIQSDNLSFGIACYIFNKRYTLNLSFLETKNILNGAIVVYGTSKNELITSLEKIPLNWNEVNTIDEISQIIIKAIQNNLYEDIEMAINDVNETFQKFVNDKYFSIVNSSAIKKPKIVSKILPYLYHNHSREDKVVLLVIDGMTYWQYLLLDKEINKLNIPTNKDFTLAWMPSITKLSRQAIFRGEAPHFDYIQSPSAESSLWETYWTSSKLTFQKRVFNSELEYNNGSLTVDNSNYLRVALVDTNLDEKMHALSNLKELYLLTENWAKETAQDIKTIYDLGYQIYITTDHGNIYAHPWRTLNSQEKTFLYKRDSRGSRHLVYSKTEYLKKFINENINIEKELLVKDKWAIWRNNKCFSNKEGITHGGAHFLEVVIPFITINKK